MGGLLLMGMRVRLSSTLAIVALGSVVATTAAAAALGGGKGHDTAVGVAARTINMSEKGSLHLASAPGTTLKEKGSTTGTFNGSVFATFTTYSVSKGAFKLTAYFPGGTLSFSGASRDHVAGATGYAEGTARVTGGTGRFAHASGSGLRYRAIVNRRNYYATTELSGRLSF
jgi:hypothetical protein